MLLQVPEPPNTQLETTQGPAPRGRRWFDGDPPATVIERWPAALSFSICLAILLAGYAIQPDARGLGTHEQLGMEPCSFLSTTGLPCATCGMTTSVSHLTHGQALASFLNQPMGFIFGLATAMTAVVSGWSVLTGMRLTGIAQQLRLPSTWFVLVLLVLLAWGYKIWTHASTL